MLTKKAIIAKLTLIISHMTEKIRDDWSDPREELRIIREACAHLAEATEQIPFGKGWRFGMHWEPNSVDPAIGKWVEDNYPCSAEAFICLVEDMYPAPCDLSDTKYLLKD